MLKPEDIYKKLKMPLLIN